MITQEQILNAQFEYWKLKPSSIPKKLINDYKTIISARQFLKNINFSEKVLVIIIDIIIEKIRNNKRFQKKTTLSIIRNIIKSKPQNITLKKATVEKLFEIYQSLILTINEDLRWMLASLLMEQELNDEQVNWLIVNSDKSVHILNRLLRYPVKNKIISDWAYTCIKQKIHGDRKSELIGKVLDYKTNYNYKNKTQWAWGVYYSSLSVNIKENLLTKNLTQENFESVIEILARYNLHKAIKQIITAANSKS
jgi:hypothetical protein